MKTTGKVYLVGAGSGDPELLTLKGKRLLEQADVIIYDRLVNPILLHLANPLAEFLYCGKVPYAHAMKQADINRKIIQHAKENKIVVRLKGGDPSIFGRVGEEIEQLERNQLSYELVPGITAASAASSYAGFSLTHRDFSGRVTLATAHKQLNEMDGSHFAPLVQGGTLCFYMGVENLALISDKLQGYGVSSEMPIALIEWGTMGRQKVLTGNLGTIVDQTKQTTIQNPAMIVVGKVVQQRKKSSWFEELPLFGERILLVSSTKLEWDELIDYTSQGADVWNLQVGANRDLRFDEVAHRYLSEQSFTSVIYKDATNSNAMKMNGTSMKDKNTSDTLKEAYQSWLLEHPLPIEYQCLAPFRNKQQTELYQVVTG
jgi:uroporphyrinogen III methyltransferase/synthase